MVLENDTFQVRSGFLKNEYLLMLIICPFPPYLEIML